MAEVKEFQYFFCVIVSTGLWKRMRRYYNELTKFDNAVGCRPKTTTTSILVLVQMSLISVLFVATPIYFRVVQFIPLHLVYVSETHYFGHLFSLLSPRIRLLSFYVESTLTNWKKSSRAEDKEFVFFSKTKRHRIKFDDLMDLYCTLVDAHDHLMDAIKWQVAVMLITSFIYLLVACWLVANYLVSNHKLVLEIALINTSLTIAELLSLLAMCLCADKARAEVRRFRELLASTLYEGQLDKSSRSSARTILTLTETRNLSFRLLRMVDMSISLPFSFLGLLVTYLIILIQFEKVIAP